MTNKIKKWDTVNGIDESEHRMTAFLDSTTDSYAILQLRDIDETREERFCPYSFLTQTGKEPDFDHYEVVYVNNLPAGVAQEDVSRQLENLFTAFNGHELPADFAGRSLSVSDVVALKINNDISFHYVDSTGFKQLERQKFFADEKKNYLRNAEMAMEDDYDMIDGIINNGKKNEPQEQERESVLEKLRQYQGAILSCDNPGEREL